MTRRVASSNADPEPPDRPFLTVEEAASLLGISRTLAYALFRDYLATHTTGLPCARIGSRRIVVPRRALDRLALPTFDTNIDPKEAA